MKEKKEENKSKVSSCAADLALVLSPLALWLLITLLLFPARPIGFVVLGGIGAPILGFSLFALRCMLGRGERFQNITMIESVPFVLGLVMVISAASALYIMPDGNVRTHYFIGLIFQSINIFFSYPSFRFTVEERLRRNRVSKSRIKKLTQGLKNYWFFTALHKECGIGIAYPLNAAFVVLFPAAVTMQLLLGWCRPLLLPVGIVMSLTLALGTVLQIFTIRHTVHGGWRNWLGNVCVMLMIAASAWVEMSLTLDVIAGKTVYR